MCAGELQSDYCMSIDEEWALDGAARAADTTTFSGCHINHSRTRFNVARRTLRKEQCVQLFAVQDIMCDTIPVHTRHKQMAVGVGGF